MKVLAVTSWSGACGIAQYAEMLRDHLPPDVELMPYAEGLDPNQFLARADWIRDKDQVLWLNYHRGLHSRWTPEFVRAIRRERGVKVVITFHDTYGEAPPDALTQALHDVADAFIVHEPCEGLPKQILIRQGVLGWPMPIYPYHFPPVEWAGRPILGTCGFNFPWKGFTKLADVTAEAGWAYRVLSNNATEADVARWRTANPYTQVCTGFLHSADIVKRLGACDATAFMYQCGNSGTSGALRLGFGARKPVYALRNCRQFRDVLEDETETYPGVRWVDNWEQLAWRLRTDSVGAQVDPGIVYRADRDAWTRQAQQYATIFQGVLQ